MTFHRYRLDHRRPPNSRTPAGAVEGAIVERDGGFGCIQPWPALGDPPLDAQLEALRAGEPTVLGEACLRCCAIDAEARRAGRSLLAGLELPPSHQLWDGVGAIAAPVVKVKSPDLAEAAARRGVRVRVDFNARLDGEQFLRWASALSPGVRERIDFVEDPTPYGPEEWERLAEASGMRLALDFGPADAVRGFAVRVWKPARLADPPRGEVLCITHNMDHPLGRRYAAYRAATFRGRLVECGLGEVELPEGAGLGELAGELGRGGR